MESCPRGLGSSASQDPIVLKCSNVVYDVILGCMLLQYVVHVSMLYLGYSIVCVTFLCAAWGVRPGKSLINGNPLLRAIHRKGKSIVNGNPV